jgi:hypothetical protein
MAQPRYVRTLALKTISFQMQPVQAALAGVSLLPISLAAPPQAERDEQREAA